MGRVGRPHKPGGIRTPSGQLSRAGKEPRVFTRFVYIMAAENTNCVKIGMSKRPVARLNDIMTHNPLRMFLYKVWEMSDAQSLQLELACHRRLKGSNVHVRGEWYMVGADVAEGVVEAVARELGIPLECKAA